MMVEDWGKLETDVDADGNFRPRTTNKVTQDSKTVRFPCSQCGGTGVYRGVRVNQPRSDCFACGGKGFFMTSERDRANTKQQRATSKVNKLALARAAFDEQYPGLSAFIAANAHWSTFLASMRDALAQYGALTERQALAVHKTQASVAQRAAERATAREAERAATAAPIDLSSIRAMFERAAAAPLNNAKAVSRRPPVYRAAGLIISRAPDHGRNPGALYVKDARTDDYLGKIIGTQYSGKPQAMTSLQAIAADPRGEAVRYGKEFGVCSCCGRELTDPVSIAAGIGPICASKWGL